MEAKEAKVCLVLFSLEAGKTKILVAVMGFSMGLGPKSARPRPINFLIKNEKKDRKLQLLSPLTSVVAY